MAYQPAELRRYRVIRDEDRKQTIIAQDLTLVDARKLQESETRTIESAPDFRMVMSRPIIVVELQEENETNG